MDILVWIMAGTLLPWFPLSWIFNKLLASAPGFWAQTLAILVFPQLGLLLLIYSGAWQALPVGLDSNLRGVALFTAVFYAFRAASTREVQVWARLMTTSGLALTWLLHGQNLDPLTLQSFALAWSIPGALMLVWAGLLEQRMGGAYLGLRGGLATVLPRLSALITLTALAASATPIFPNFFILLHVVKALPLVWIPGGLLVLLLWGWAVGRFLQDLLFGIYRGELLEDLTVGGTWLGGLVLGLFAVGGIFWGGAWIMN